MTTEQLKEWIKNQQVAEAHLYDCYIDTERLGGPELRELAKRAVIFNLEVSQTILRDIAATVSYSFTYFDLIWLARRELRRIALAQPGGYSDLNLQDYLDAAEFVVPTDTDEAARVVLLSPKASDEYRAALLSVPGIGVREYLRDSIKRNLS